LYGYLNLIPDDADLAKILPRNTTKQEFYVEIPKNNRLEEENEDESEDEYTDLIVIDPNQNNNPIPKLPISKRPVALAERLESTILEEFFETKEDELEKEI